MAKTFKSLLVVASIIIFAVLLACGAGQNSVEIYGLPSLVVFAALAFAVQWVVFIPSYWFQTEHYYDLTGSATYVLVVVSAALAGQLVTAMDPRGLLVSVLVVVWAARLGLFLFRRVKRAGKDGRFDHIKPYWPRFLVVWTLQGLWVFVTLLAALVVLSAETGKPLGVIGLLGVTVWLVGFTIEVIADRQKSAFNAVPENQGRFVNVGLWRWSRHPNYFGEIVLWCGIAIIAMPVLQGWQWLAMISPVFVAVLLTKISGVPLLEKRADDKWGADADYQQYKAGTSVLIPLPPGRVSR